MAANVYEALPLVYSGVCFHLQKGTVKKFTWQTYKGFPISFSAPSALTGKSLEYKVGEIASTVHLLLLSFCHPEARLVNAPSESIGLRDGGVQE